MFNEIKLLYQLRNLFFFRREVVDNGLDAINRENRALFPTFRQDATFHASIFKKDGNFSPLLALFKNILSGHNTGRLQSFLPGCMCGHRFSYGENSCIT